MFGFLNINKPSGMSSHKVVSILRKITGIKQIGHAGTLDPLASGVLPIAIGKASKLIDYLPSDKRYAAGLEFGKKSDTYDIEGKIEVLNNQPVTLSQIKKIMPLFTGEIKQIPPMYSAVHYNGKRLYELARAGKTLDDIPSRLIKIYKNEIIEFDEAKQKLKLDIACSKGTYIRTIVNDIGEVLNTGAIMYELTRIKSGGMDLENSLELVDNLTVEEIEKNLINPVEVVPLPCVEIDEHEIKIIEHGNKILNKCNVKNEVLLVKNKRVIALAYCERDFIQPKKLML